MKTTRNNVRRRSIAVPFDGELRLKPLAAAIAMIVVTGTLAPPVQAQQAFSGGWFAAKVGVQTGRLPSGLPASSLTGPAGQQQRAAQQLQRSTDNLNLSAQRIAAQQAAARAAALASGGSVPDGLADGGLKIDTNSLTASWFNANAPVQTVTDGRTNVAIRQTSDKAILNWETFNVGSNTTVNFDQQGNRSWIALNKVNDPRMAPSAILGRINAHGQVYVINRNGILFGAGSQINVGTLIASTLPIHQPLFDAGTLFSNADNKFTFSAYSQTAGANGPTDAVEVGAATAASQTSGVVVEAGATITTATTADRSGGRVILIGPVVRNSGSITTPDGQTILAAGQQVALLPHSSDDPGLRGLDVYVGSVFAPAAGIANPLVSSASNVSGVRTGKASNDGIIVAKRGNITLTGAEVVQDGVLASTTSVSLNGSIRIDASFGATGTTNISNRFAQAQTGAVTLGKGSLIQVLPEWDSDETVAADALALASRVDLRGRTIHLAKDSLLLATGGIVNLDAGLWDYTASGAQFRYSDGQIYLDEGAVIDVSGSAAVPVDVARNIIAVELRGAELADSPVLRDSPLRGKTVYVDIRRTGIKGDGSVWIGTPLADVSGYAALVNRKVGELTIDGGTVNLNAGGSVVAQQGSRIDTSSGWIDYQGGLVKSATRLLGADGRLFDISQARPDQSYTVADGFTRTHARWGVTESWTNLLLNTPILEMGYMHGGNGGRLTIRAPGVALLGDMQGSVITGERQREVRPEGSAFTLDFVQAPQSGVLTRLPPARTPDVVFQKEKGERAAAAFDPASRLLDPETPVVFASHLLGDTGFAHVAVTTSNGDVAVDTALTGQDGGSLTLTARNLGVAGNIALAGGRISLEAKELDPAITRNESFLGTAADIAGRGRLTVHEGVTLSTAGRLTEERLDGGVLPLLNGGSIALTAFHLDLQQDSVLDVSGGATVARSGSVKLGDAGSITLYGGQSAGKHGTIDPTVEGLFAFGSKLHGYGQRGGILDIGAPLIQIGGGTDRSDVLLWDVAEFNRGGFSHFALTGTGRDGAPGLLVTAGAEVVPQVQRRTLLTDSAGQHMLGSVLLPRELRDAVSLSLNATGLLIAGNPRLRGDLIVEEGATIRLDPTLTGTGSVSINTTGSANTAAILGSILVPGGSIEIAAKGSSLLSEQSFVANTVLGPNSALSTAGAVVIDPLDPRGRRNGRVLDGGSIKVGGNALAQAGSVLDVSGASGILDVPVSGPAGLLAMGGVPALRLDSNGGSIVLSGANGLYTEATLRGKAGGATASGGSLSVGSARADQAPASNLIVTQKRLDGFSYEDGLAAVGQFVSKDGSAIALGHFALEDFSAGGFDSLTLAGNVEFSGAIDLSVRRSLTLATGGLLSADAAVRLGAPYIAVGRAYAAPVVDVNTRLPLLLAPTTPARSPSGQLVETAIAPSHGGGTLTLEAATLLDVGSAALRGIGSATLDAGSGDIRGYGSFFATGDVTLHAAQVYPTTGALFNIAAFDPADGQGRVRFQGSGVTRPAPLSAGGTLNVYASLIQQDGVLRAPLGAINLGTDASVSTVVGPGTAGAAQILPVGREVSLGGSSITSVSALDLATGVPLLLPYGTHDSTKWLDPLGRDITNGGPEKAINLAGDAIDIRHGALLDLDGGGDLQAYRWLPGIGGSRDILAQPGSYAVLPDYGANYAPLASVSTPAGTEAGWSQSGIAVGDRVWLDGAAGLPARWYTLLPARYALLPGAFLVTPTGASIAGTVSQAGADGASLVTGRMENSFNGARATSALNRMFEVASGAVVRARSEYSESFANTAWTEAAQEAGHTVPRRPLDAGSIRFVVNRSLDIQGTTRMRPGQTETGEKGRGGIADIASGSDILVVAPDRRGTAPEGVLVLDAAGLSGFGAESLLIGGYRRTTAGGVQVTPTTANIEVDNAGTALTGPEIILAARETLHLADGAEIAQQGKLSAAAETLLFGTAGVAGSGEGALIRVSSDAAADIVRAGLLPGGGASLDIGAGARLSGVRVVLDSTGAIRFDPAARVTAESLTLGSGQISLLLDDAGAAQPTSGLVLPQAVLANVQGMTRTLALKSYSSIDLYGHGSIGGLGDDGRATVESLTLQAGGLRGFNIQGGTVTINARQVSINNTPGAAAVAPVAGVNDTLGGTLAIHGETFAVGQGAFNVAGYADVNIVAADGVYGSGAGGLSTAGDLRVASARITAATGAEQHLRAGGLLNIASAPAREGGTPPVGGIGARLELRGASVVHDGVIQLASGQVTLHADGDLRVNGSLDVSGTAQRYFDQVRYTPGGVVTLTANRGDVVLGADSLIDVSAHAAAGHAGMLSISATEGTLTTAGRLRGEAGAGGDSAAFLLDVGRLPTLASTSAALDPGGFARLRSVRVREGDVLIDGAATARAFALSADDGTITVTGSIDASGETGGTVALYGWRGVTLASGARINVAGKRFDSAGKGGSIHLEAGEARAIGGQMVAGAGWIDLQAGSVIDLSVASAADGRGGKLHLRAPQITGVDSPGKPIPTLANGVAGTDVAIKPLQGQIIGAASVVAEGFHVFDLSDAGGVITPVVQADVHANAEAFTAHTAAITQRLLAGTANAGLGERFHLQPGTEVVSRSTLPVTLTAPGGSLDVPAGTLLRFPAGVDAGNTVRFSVAGRYTDANGSVTAFAAGEAIAIGANGVVALDGAGQVEFVSGTAPVNLQLVGTNDVSTGVGSQTVLRATGNGLGIALGDASGITIPLNAVATLEQDAGAATFTLERMRLAIPAGGSAIQLVVSGATLTYGTVVPDRLPEGAYLVANGTAVRYLNTIGTSGNVVALPTGATLKLGRNTTTQIALAAGDTVRNSGANAALRVTADVPFSVNGVNYAAGTPVAYSTANRPVVLAANGSLTWTTNTTAGTYSGNVSFTLVNPAGYATATLGQTNITTTSYQYTVNNGARILSLAPASTLNGSFIFDSPTPMEKALAAGSYTFTTPTVVRGISAGSTLTGQAGGGVVALDNAAAPLGLNLGVGEYAATGRIRATPAGDLILPVSGQVVLSPDSTVRLPPGVSVPGFTLPTGARLTLPTGLRIATTTTDNTTVRLTQAGQRLDASSTTVIYLMFLEGGQVTISSPITVNPTFDGEFEQWSGGTDYPAGSTVTLAPNSRVRMNSSGSVTVGGPMQIRFSGESGGTSSQPFTAAFVANGAPIELTQLTATARLLSGAVSGMLALNGGTSAVNLTLPGDWNLSGNRYGPNANPLLPGSGEPGVLTLRAEGNVLLQASLLDGFMPAVAYAAPYNNLDASKRWNDVLLPEGSASWSYRLVAGADLSGAAFHNVRPLDKVAEGSGSFQLGQLMPAGATSTGTSDALLAAYHQVIRTGTGDIDIAAARDVQLLNTFASIYTAGSQVTPDTATRAVTLAPGGSVTLATRETVRFDSALRSGDALVSSTDGIITYRKEVDVPDLPILPAGAVFSFPVGWNGINSRATAARNELVTLHIGAQIRSERAGSAVAGFKAGDMVGFVYALPANAVTATSSGTYYQSSIAGRFEAGQPLPALAAGSYILLDNGGTLTTLSNTTVGLDLPVGRFVITAAGGTPATDYPSFQHLPASSSLRPLDAAGGGVTNFRGVPIIATVPLVAGIATPLLLSNASVSLNGAGQLALAGGNTAAITVNGGDSGWLYDTPRVGGHTNSTSAGGTAGALPGAWYLPQFSTGGGNVTLKAGRDIIHLTEKGALDTSYQMPTNWLYRRSRVEDGRFTEGVNGDVQSTTWWVDYSNFYQGVGALGGGNVTLNAGRDVANVDAVAPTNAWMPHATVSASGIDRQAASQPLFEYGGGDVRVAGGRNIDGGVYYVERGRGTLAAGGDITTNRLRGTPVNSLLQQLPTTLFLGKGDFALSAHGDILMGPVANPFLMPQGILNGAWYRSYFSTYAPESSVTAESLTGSVQLKGEASGSHVAAAGTLADWYGFILANYTNGFSDTHPWLRLIDGQRYSTFNNSSSGFTWRLSVLSSSNASNVASWNYHLTGLLAPSLHVTAFSGDIRLRNSLTLAPSPVGTLDLIAGGAIDGTAVTNASISLSDMDPDRFPGIRTPLDLVWTNTPLPLPSTLLGTFPFVSMERLRRSLSETGDTRGANARSFIQQGLHDADLLHRNDGTPVYLYAAGGDISGLVLYSPKQTRIMAHRDIGDTAFYLQHLNAGDLSIVSAGRDFIAYNETTAARQAGGIPIGVNQGASTGDISLGGPGTLEVLAGRHLDLGAGTANTNLAGEQARAGVALGLTSIGNARNPYLPANEGAAIIAAAGLGGAGLSASALDVPAFVSTWLDPAGGPGAVYLPVIAERLGLAGDDLAAIRAGFDALPAERRSALALEAFYLVLRDTGRAYNDPESATYQQYKGGFSAIEALFPRADWRGDISLTSRLVRTQTGGDIFLLAPGGAVNVGLDRADRQPLDQGIMTLRGGDISIFSQGNVEVGTSRIFTFRGGDVMIWSSRGNIAAGSASKTLQSAPPARYLVDEDTGDSVLDLAGLATGGGIGVLQTLKNVPPGDVDLIAPFGFVDAGDAGIRVSGNINIAALQVLNAGNIQVKGEAMGIPAVAAVNVAALTNASAAASTAAATAQEVLQRERVATRQALPSIFTVRVLGFGNEPLEPSSSSSSSPSVDPSTVNPRSVVRVLGAGEPSESARSQLTARERGNLAR